MKSHFLLVRNEEVEANLIQSLKDRNKLVHHFFWDNAAEQQSSEGRRSMAGELRRVHAQFLRTINDFETANKALRKHLGVTEQMTDRIVAAAKAAATKVQEEIVAKVRELREQRSSPRADMI